MKGAASLSSTLLARKGSAAPLGGASVAPLWAQARPQGNANGAPANGAPANGAAAGDRELPRPPAKPSSQGPRRTFRRVPDEAYAKPASNPGDPVIADDENANEAIPEPVSVAAGVPTPPADAPEAAAASEASSEEPSTCAMAVATGEPCIPGQEMDKTVKVSLRLDPERHLRLRLASAHLRRSAQKILMSALESYLDTTVGTPANATCACFKYRSGDQSTSN